MSRAISISSIPYHTVKAEKLDRNLPAAIPPTVFRESTAAQIARDAEISELDRAHAVVDFHERCAAVAKTVIENTNRLATNGSNRASDGANFTAEEVAVKTLSARSFRESLYHSIPQELKSLRSDAENWIRAQGQAFERLGYGQCAEMATYVVAMLLDTDVRPLDLVQMGPDGGHQLCVVGRRTGSDPNDVRTWGDTAFAVDAWAKKSYALSSLDEMRKPEHDVPYSEGYRQLHQKLTGNLPPHYLTGEMKSIARFD